MEKSESIWRFIGGVTKVIAFVILIVTVIPACLFFKFVVPSRPFILPRYFHFFLLKIFGIKVHVSGKASDASPVLFVANHSSYLDIPVIGSLVGGSFVAKSDVASWPLFGFLCRVQNTIFIERRPSRAVEQKSQLSEHLDKRQNLILFPEGTSSQGLSVLPFKSSLFSIVDQTALGMWPLIQPISITCTHLDGHVLTVPARDTYAWHGDMTLPPHLWNVFKRGAFTVHVIFHNPLRPSDVSGRKALALACQSLVARGIEQSLSEARA